MFEQGFHFVGDWHTHPEAVPSPSSMDLNSIGECVRRSRHGFSGFFLVILGTQVPPAGLHVSFHTGAAWTSLDPVQS